MFIGTGHQIVKQRIGLSYRSFELIESHEGVERACNAPRPTSFSCVVQQIENCLFEHRFSSPLWPGKLLKIRYTRELGEKQVDQTREKGVLFHQRFISDIIARKIAPCCPSNSQQTVPDHASRFLQHFSLSLSVGGARGYARGYESLGWQTRKGVHSLSNPYRVTRCTNDREGKCVFGESSIGVGRWTSKHLTPITLPHLNFNRPTWHRVLALLLPLTCSPDYVSSARNFSSAAC